MEEKKLLTVKEIADYLNMSEQAIYKMTFANAKFPIPFLKIGGQLRFDPEKIKEWLEDKKFND